ncbi:hypothetical protein ACRAWG_30010 [Methylobacterium sp. P31]
MPFLIESRYDPPRLPGLPLPRFLPAALRAYVNLGVDKVAVGPFTLPPLNALRARLGLDPVYRLRHWWNSPTRMLLMFPDWYAEPQADWPAQAVQLGFPSSIASATCRRCRGSWRPSWQRARRRSSSPTARRCVRAPTSSTLR